MSIHTLDGRFVCHALDRRLAAGFYRLNPLRPLLEAGIYAVRLRIGGKSAGFRMLSVNGRNGAGVITFKSSTGFPVQGHLEKRVAVIDTVRVSKEGFVPSVRPRAKPGRTCRKPSSVRGSCSSAPRCCRRRKI